MKTIVVYKSKYGATKEYAQWIGKELDCQVTDAKLVSVEDLLTYDTIIYGGGLYAEVIDGVRLITKNFDRLKEKNLIVFSTGITPLDCSEYYDKMVVEKNFKPEMRTSIKTFYFLGKMILSELSVVHRTAIKALKKLMASKENPTEMEKLLVDLCDADGDFTDRNAIHPLVEYVKAL
ncbi:MAG: flavodoxin [Clostridia bacterium]|nr:flavodoxin [Clostridia bacterium]